MFEKGVLTGYHLLHLPFDSSLPLDILHQSKETSAVLLQNTPSEWIAFGILMRCLVSE